MQTGLLIVVVLYALIGLGGWRNHRILCRREEAVALLVMPEVTIRTAEPAPIRPAFVLGKTPFAAETLSARVVLNGVLSTLDAEAARGLTRLTLAVAPRLTLRADPGALQHALLDLVGGAIRRSPHGQVLVCAALHGGRVQISVTDEGASSGAEALAELSETACGIVALHGGTLEAQHHPGGVTLVLRLPTPSEQLRKPAAALSQAGIAPVAPAVTPVASCPEPAAVEGMVTDIRQSDALVRRRAAASPC